MYSASKTRLRKTMLQGIADTGENGDGVRMNAPTIRGLRHFRDCELVDQFPFEGENECPDDQGIETWPTWSSS